MYLTCIILCSPIEKLNVGLAKQRDLAFPQPLNANGCVKVQEYDKIKRILQCRAPIDY